MSHAITATTDASGNVITSDDPGTNPNASITSKVAGDVKGAARGVASSTQAVLGTAIRNKRMADEGFEMATIPCCSPVLTLTQRTRDLGVWPP